MDQRLLELERRVLRAERIVKVLGATLVLAIAWALALPAAHGAGARAGTVRSGPTRVQAPFDVVNARGELLVRMGQNADGAPYMRMLDNRGSRRIDLEGDQYGGHVTLSGKYGVMQARVDPSGSVLVLNNHSASTNVTIRARGQGAEVGAWSWADNIERAVRMSSSHGEQSMEMGRVIRPLGDGHNVWRPAITLSDYRGVPPSIELRDSADKPIFVAP